LELAAWCGDDAERNLVEDAVGGEIDEGASGEGRL
jgi:hypothetical protein